MKRATILAREEFKRVKAGQEPTILELKKGYAKLLQVSQKKQP